MENKKLLLKDIGFETAIIDTNLITEQDLDRWEINNKIRNNYKQNKFIVIIKKDHENHIYTAQIFNNIKDCHAFIDAFIAERYENNVPTLEENIELLEKHYKLQTCPAKTFEGQHETCIQPRPKELINYLFLTLKAYYTPIIKTKSAHRMEEEKSPGYALTFNFKGKYYTKHFSDFKQFIQICVHFHNKIYNI